MIDVFISYKRERREIAKKLADALEAQGYRVWWDAELLPGDVFWDEIEAILNQAKAAIVLWCPLAKESQPVKAEAHHALDREIYIGAKLDEGLTPPMRFKTSHLADLSRFAQDGSGLPKLLDALKHQIGEPSTPAPQTPAFDEEAAFWRAIRENPEPGELRLYLKRYGEQGAFAEIALAKLAALQPAEAKAPEPEAAPSYEPPSIFQDTLKSGGKGPEMVVIPAGSFMMGSPHDEPEQHDSEGPLHEVRIERPFAMGRFVVTRGEFAEFVQASGHKVEKGLWFGTGLEFQNDPSRDWRNPGFAQADDHPVVGVSHQDAQAYCKWLSKQTDKEYHLPSEAQWEYACRAGTQTPFWWGDQISPEQANYNGNYAYNDGAKGVFRQKTVPVKTFNANDWGLYQAHGNVWEWCADAWNYNYQDAPNDGSAWLAGDSFMAVLRGGSWDSDPLWLRSADRNRNHRASRGNGVGFRLSRTLSSR